MLRLANLAFEQAPKLHKLSSYCLTETIKAHLVPYFEEGYELENAETLYTKVKVEKVLKIFPEKIIREMALIDVDAAVFTSKKVAQFMTQLNSEEEHVPDVFIEYMLVRFIKSQSRMGEDYTPHQVKVRKSELKRLLNHYAVVYECDFHETEEGQIECAKEFAEEYTILATDFTRLQGINGPDDRTLVFWDWDYMFFDDWGFTETIFQLAHGVFLGYGLAYTNNMFTSIDEDIPSIIKNV
ncbi:hypothetical protein QTG56_25520 (plasmid) [Rossellomorea sp. AcN35-11]|nr:hypothetical protein [Rossellomorea aquimaris]WJV31976.1 hypothetical protein QTG56_25520 [Rossellomorea sp. AcN35-11]